MYQLKSHNLSITPEVTHYDSNGNKVKTIAYPASSLVGEDSNIELTLYNVDGTVKDVFKCPFGSFTQNFARMMMSRSFTTAGNNINLIDTSGTTRTVASQNNMFGYTAPVAAGVYTWGILVNASGSSWATGSVLHTGSFTTANGPASGIIAHGTGIGSMSYAIQTADAALTEVSGSWKFGLSRVFTNNSVANINIKEVDLVTNTYASNYKMLIARDLKDSNGNDINVTVAPGQVLTVKYNIFAPVNSGVHRHLLGHLFAELTGLALTNAVCPVWSDTYYATIAAPGINDNYVWMHSSGVNTAWNGIMPGKGDETESLDITADHINWITHGSSSLDELKYGANEWDGAQYVFSTSGSSLEWNLKRNFTNGFADPVVVKEAMILASKDASYDNGLKTSGTKIMVVRKLIGTQTISSGSSLQINFKFMIEA